MGNTLSSKKIDVCDDLGIESFFEHVLNRTEEILDENSNVSSEHGISTHVDLLERTVNPEYPPWVLHVQNGVLLLNNTNLLLFCPSRCLFAY